MIKQSFNQDWFVGPHTSFTNMMPGAPEPVTLPHDAMIAKDRDPQAASGDKKGFYPDGIYDYTKKFFVPEEYKGKRVIFEFEGVYANAMVYINDDLAGQHPYGYSQFYVKADRFLNYGEENEIKVVARSYDDSRWYTGTGIYRNVKLIVANPTHIALDSVKITTPDIAHGRAIVQVAAVIENEGMNRQALKVQTEIIDANGKVVASDTAPLTAFAGEHAALRQRLYVKQPNLWNVDTPYLYQCRIQLLDGENLLDEEVTSFGIRSLSLDAIDGLRINGEVVKLRGACIHHDNGVIGAATIDRAEERRVELLKQAGFNALRSSHNPMSKAMLDACDRLGMLVMDEAFDVWTINKSGYDYALHFPEWWERDIEAMVNKNFNHPSVIIYSIGNEISETGTPNGAAWGRKLAEKIRSMDDSRFIINSINGILSVMSKLRKIMATQAAEQSQPGGNFNNTMVGNMAESMKQINQSELVTEATAESFAAVDIAGYNYGDSRYVMDKDLFPNRVVCGSETFPPDIAKNWKLVREYGHVIGDFTWTGWEYLGESGAGKVLYEGDPGFGEFSFGAGFEWLTANTGDLDLTGYRRPQSYYREIVFGLRQEPYITVQRPEHYGKQVELSSWALSDTVASWSWEGFEGKPVKVEVYSDADEVELIINGEVVGRADAGEKHAYRVVYDTVYTPGEIAAVGYRNGEEIGRTVLRSADETLRLHVEADRDEIAATDEDLSFISVTLTDHDGIPKPLADREVSVQIDGPGILQGFGSGDPKGDGNFRRSKQKTYEGRVLAVIRPTAAGVITATFEAEGCETVSVQVSAR